MSVLSTRVGQYRVTRYTNLFGGSSALTFTQVKSDNGTTFNYSDLDTAMYWAREMQLDDEAVLGEQCDTYIATRPMIGAVRQSTLKVKRDFIRENRNSRTCQRIVEAKWANTLTNYGH